jgi:general secretion pathway protein E
MGATYGNFYINLVYWVLAIATVIAWSRFILFISMDVRTNLRHASPLLWDAVGLGSIAGIILIWLVVPIFWLAFPIIFLGVAGLVAWYWVIRVGELGAAGHLFGGAMRAAGKFSQRREEQRVGGDLGLKYLQNNENPLNIPPPEDPLHQFLIAGDALLLTMLEKRAEIFELTPAGEAYDAKLIIDGVPYTQPALARTTAEGVIQTLKTISGLSLDERRRPQQGSFKTIAPDGAIAGITVRTSGTTSGERLAVSANEKGRWRLPMEQLGLAPDQLTQVKAIVTDKTRVVLVATPKGNGKTATMYALLRAHDAFTNSVMTLEINPQDDLESVSVGKFDPRDPKITFARAAQSIFLKDPDVSMIAQCPDTATADAIARFAADGRRVYVGMVANDTLNALEAWLKLNTDKKQAVDSLNAVIAERLVRLLCPTCKISFQPDEATLKKMGLPVGRNLQSFKANTDPITDEKGNQMMCPDCGGLGYRGRTGIFEVLVITDEIRNAIISNGTVQAVRAIARKNQMMLLSEHGFRKFATGLTSLNEVARVLQTDKPATKPAAAKR